MKKLLFLTGLIIFGFLILPGVARANVSGWAWSSNIGWISFNCTNRGTCATVNYGVHIDPATGNFSGFAWSANIGWINFAPAGPYPALPNHSARVDLATGNVSGWARVCAVFATGCSGALNPNRGDWDGWIKLRGPNYGVSISATTGEFSGWAWSDMVIGWTSFRGVNYRVITIPDLFNAFPSATNLSVRQGNYCEATSPPIFLEWVFSDPNPGNTQSAYQIQVDNQAGFPSPEIDSGRVAGPAGVSQSYTPPGLSFNTTYHWRVRVWDNHNLVSAWSVGPSFATLRRHPAPSFTWSPPSPTANESIQFTDNSRCFDVDGVCNTWRWTFGDGATSTLRHPRHTFTTHGSFTVTLTVTDDVASCPGPRVVTIGLPLPEYREIAPIVWLEKLFASITAFINNF